MGLLYGLYLQPESGTETKFGTQKDLKVLNNVKFNYHFSESRDMSRDHYSTIRKSTNSINKEK